MGCEAEFKACSDSQLWGQHIAQTMERTELCSLQYTPRMGFCQELENMARATMKPEPQCCSHPGCLVCCYMGELSGWVSKTQNTGPASVTGRQGKGHTHAMWCWHPHCSPTILTYSKLPGRDIYGPQSRHPVLLLVLG